MVSSACLQLILIQMQSQLDTPILNDYFNLFASLAYLLLKTGLFTFENPKFSSNLPQSQNYN